MAKNDDKDDNDIHLKVVVNGKGVPMKAAPDLLLGALVALTLEKANVAIGNDPDRWNFTNAAGATLDKNKPVGSFGFQKNEEIALTLDAGVVG